MFAGQGAQHPGMGLALSQSSAAAAKIYRDADAILGWELSELCFQGPQEELTACAHCQPAIFVTSMAAYAARLENPVEGEEIVAMGGLSLGEVTAVTASGVVDFENGLKMVARRGELMDLCCQKSQGVMAAVIACDENALAEACKKFGVVVANYNSPGQRIVSGEKSAVEAVCQALTGVALKTQLLQVAGAYHSPLMQEASDAFREFLAGVPFQAPSVPLVHNVTGGWTADASLDLKELLARQVSSSVRWEECAQALTGVCDSLVEMGPGKVLCGLMKRINRQFPTQATDL